MEKLRIGKWASDLATPEEVARWREEARALVKKYGWENRTVTPYSWAEPVLDIINYGCHRDGTDGYALCTHSSKQYVLEMLNGLVPILNSWERTELYGVLLLNKTTGKTFKCDRDLAEEMVKIDGLEYAEEVTR